MVRSGDDRTAAPQWTRVHREGEPLQSHGFINFVDASEYGAATRWRKPELRATQILKVRDVDEREVPAYAGGPRTQAARPVAALCRQVGEGGWRALTSGRHLGAPHQCAL